eukprot:6455422-Amphidinium_carterae.2
MVLVDHARIYPEDVLNTYAKELGARDPSGWQIDQGVYAFVFGPHGTANLQTKWMESVLPTSDHARPASEALDESKNFAKRDIFQYSSAAAKSTIMAAESLIESVSASKAPLADAASTEGFISRVYQKLINFVVYEVDTSTNEVDFSPSGPVGEGKKRVVGESALPLQLAYVCKMQKENIMQSHIAALSAFQHLLGPDEASSFKDLLELIVAESNKKRKAAPKALPKDADLKGEARKKRKTLASASKIDDEASQLLGLL